MPCEFYLRIARPECVEAGHSIGVDYVRASELAGAVSEIERLRQGLRDFGIHAQSCPRHRLFDECTCGLLELQRGR